jgi:hypothetical protein
MSQKKMVYCTPAAPPKVGALLLPNCMGMVLMWFGGGEEVVVNAMLSYNIN